MIMFFLFLLEPSSILSPGGRVVLFRGITFPLPAARRPSSPGDRSSTSTTRPRRLSAANRPALWGLRDSGPFLHVRWANTLDEAVDRN